MERFAVGNERSLPIAGAARWRELNEEVAVVAAAVRDDDHIFALPRDFDDRLEIAGRRVLLRGEFDVARVLGLSQSRVVRRRCDALEARGGVDLHVDLQIAERVLFQQLALEGVAVAVAVALQRQHLRVGDFDALLRTGRDRVDARFEDVAAGPFEQAGVALLAQDRLVDFAGALLLHDIRFDEVIADPHAETGDGRVLRQREMEHAFEHAVGAVDERFFDHGARDLIADVHGDVVITDRQWHVATVHGGDERAERFGGRCAFEALQPLRFLVDADEFVFFDADELPAFDLQRLLVGAVQFHRCAGRGGDLEFPGQQFDFVGLHQLDRRMWADDDACGGEQPECHGVGPA